jgi:DNA-directed RNA polymerase omega subunit
LKFSKEIDSKFRFVIIASKRAKQLLCGAKPKVKSKFRNLIRIAQEEIEQGLIGFDLVRSIKEEAHDVKDDVLIGQELTNEEEEPEEEAAKVEPEKDEEGSEEDEEEKSDDDLADEPDEAEEK